jgi:hypothetical protein
MIRLDHGIAARLFGTSPASLGEAVEQGGR